MHPHIRQEEIEAYKAKRHDDVRHETEHLSRDCGDDPQLTEVGMAQGREEECGTARDRQQQGEEDERPEVVDDTA